MGWRSPEGFIDENFGIGFPLNGDEGVVLSVVLRDKWGQGSRHPVRKNSPRKNQTKIKEM